MDFDQRLREMEQPNLHGSAPSFQGQIEIPGLNLQLKSPVDIFLIIPVLCDPEQFVAIITYSEPLPSQNIMSVFNMALSIYHMFI